MTTPRSAWVAGAFRSAHPARRAAARTAVPEGTTVSGGSACAHAPTDRHAAGRSAVRAIAGAPIPARAAARAVAAGRKLAGASAARKAATAATSARVSAVRRGSRAAHGGRTGAPTTGFAVPRECGDETFAKDGGFARSGARTVCCERDRYVKAFGACCPPGWKVLTKPTFGIEWCCPAQYECNGVCCTNPITTKGLPPELAQVCRNGRCVSP